ncbi:MAG TPA: CGNR zinc finger domain-containing protein [Amycolatopsis sp.]|nr:CGNR zinc finger domain-containing protein [Amycolatopsis sp.]HKS49734.1 CGNR zinc finger domain-containing protein [Amycolatopsis sp.]
MVSTLGICTPTAAITDRGASGSCRPRRWPWRCCSPERQVVPGGIGAVRSCQAVYLGAGNGGPRKYCSARCATRKRVAAHRARGT